MELKQISNEAISLAVTLLDVMSNPAKARELLDLMGRSAAECRVNLEKIEKQAAFVAKGEEAFAPIRAEIARKEQMLSQQDLSLADREQRLADAVTAHANQQITDRGELEALRIAAHTAEVAAQSAKEQADRRCAAADEAEAQLAVREAAVKAREDKLREALA